MSIKKKIITIIVALAVVAMVAPGVAQGVTIEELLAQIAQLQAQLLALQQAQGVTPTGGGYAGIPAGFTFTKTLQYGSVDQDVVYLKTVLAAEGCVSGLSNTTYFGSSTKAGVQCFQAKYGTGSLGTTGPNTRAKLNFLLGAGTPGTPGTPVVPTGAISAMLAASTPPAGALINSQATAGLLHINFTGTGTVTSVTLRRSGISDQNTLSNVYLYDGITRLTDGYSFNVNGQMVMSGLSIAVNGSKTIAVKADVASDATTYASSIAVALTSYTANGAVSGANVQGNTQAIVTGSAASVTVGTQTVGNANVNAGTTGYTFWSAPVQINTRAVLLKTANFRMVGSAPSDALGNIKMFVDGVDTGKIATVVTVTGSNYAMFDLTSAPITLTTGSHTIDVRADVQKGSYRNVALSVQQAADLTITDPQVGVNIAASGIPTGSGTISILQGSTTTVVDPTFTSATNITSGAANAVIGRFNIRAYGEDIKVSSIQVTPLIKSATTTGATCTTDSSGTSVSGACGLNNVTLYFNGSQVSSSSNWTHALMAAATPITYQLGSQMILPAGQDSIVEVRADLQTAANVAYTGGTIIVTLVGDTDNAYGQSSQYTVGVPQTTSVATTGLTISSAALVVSKNTGLANYTVAPNTAGAKIGSYTVQNQSTSEAVRLTSLNVKMYDASDDAVLSSATTPALTNFSALRTSDTTGSGSTPVQPTANDTFSVSDVLQPGASMIIDIFANTGSQASSYQFYTKLTVASIGVTSNIASSGTITTGQTITLGTGAITDPPTLVVSSTTPAQYIAAAGGATNASQATFNFISTSAASTITELKFTVTGSDANPSQTVTSICVGSVCGSPAVSSGAQTVYLTGLSLNVPVAGGLSQNVLVSYAPVGSGGVTPDKTSLITLTYVKYISGGTTTSFTPSVAAKTVTLVGSKPTVTVSGSGTLILGAQNKIGSVTVTADPRGAIKVRRITFTVSNSGFGADGSVMAIADTAGTTPFLTLAGSTTQISGNYCDINAGDTEVVCDLGGNGNTDYALDFLIGAGSPQTFDLYATVDGAAASGLKASVSTSLTAAGFTWDDTSTNGASATGLTGALIYNFPTNSYTISQ